MNQKISVSKLTKHVEQHHYLIQTRILANSLFREQFNMKIQNIESRALVALIETLKESILQKIQQSKRFINMHFRIQKTKKFLFHHKFQKYVKMHLELNKSKKS